MKQKTPDMLFILFILEVARKNILKPQHPVSWCCSQCTSAYLTYLAKGSFCLVWQFNYKTHNKYAISRLQHHLWRFILRSEKNDLQHFKYNKFLRKNIKSKWCFSIIWYDKLRILIITRYFVGSTEKIL